METANLTTSITKVGAATAEATEPFTFQAVFWVVFFLVQCCLSPISVALPELKALITPILNENLNVFFLLDQLLHSRLKIPLSYLYMKVLIRSCPSFNLVARQVKRTEAVLLFNPYIEENVFIPSQSH